MTKEFNQCSKLMNDESFQEALGTYNKVTFEGKDTLGYMLEMQRDLQKALSRKLPEFNPDPDELNTLGQKFDWLRENKQAFDDEYSEIIDALPGMSTPSKDRSAIWKRWKAKYPEIREQTFDDLSEDDLKELKYELVDAWHFFMNMMFALDMSAEELFVYYVTKNQENHRRAREGY